MRGYWAASLLTQRQAAELRWGHGPPAVAGQIFTRPSQHLGGGASQEQEEEIEQAGEEGQAAAEGGDTEMGEAHEEEAALGAGGAAAIPAVDYPEGGYWALPVAARVGMLHTLIHDALECGELRCVGGWVGGWVGCQALLCWGRGGFAWKRRLCLTQCCLRPRGHLPAYLLPAWLPACLAGCREFIEGSMGDAEDEEKERRQELAGVSERARLTDAVPLSLSLHTTAAGSAPQPCPELPCVCLRLGNAWPDRGLADCQPAQLCPCPPVPTRLPLRQTAAGAQGGAGGDCPRAGPADCPHDCQRLHRRADPGAAAADAGRGTGAGRSRGSHRWARLLCVPAGPGWCRDLCMRCLPAPSPC